jgi:3-hydroxyacyl-[acyl-carrier-protein] dehydratase
MKFLLYDDTIEQTQGRIVVLKQVSRAEEYLADHFPGFAVLPGVLMLEAMVQAARRLLQDAGGKGPMVLGEVSGFRFGAMVRPGAAILVEVSAEPAGAGGEVACRGAATLRADAGAGETAARGRFTMRPLRPAVAVAAPGPARHEHSGGLG